MRPTSGRSSTPILPKDDYQTSFGYYSSNDNYSHHNDNNELFNIEIKEIKNEPMKMKKRTKINIHEELGHIPNEIRRHIIPILGTGSPLKTEKECILKLYTWTPVEINKKGEYLVTTPMHIAKEGICIQPGIVNDRQIWAINYTNKAKKIQRKQHIGNIKTIKEIFNFHKYEIEIDKKEIPEEERLKILVNNTHEKYKHVMKPIFEKYIQIFRRKIEKGTSFNKKMFEEITLDLIVPEKDISFKVKANKIRQYSEDQIEQADKLYKELRESGHIEPSKSTWMSPLVIVPKPYGSYRAAVDYSNLNKYLKNDSYEIPNINVLLQKLASHKIFSTCDFKMLFISFRLGKLINIRLLYFFLAK